MARPDRRVVRACEAWLRASAALVPLDVRHEWLREWRAELAHEIWRRERLGRPHGAREDARLALRVSGALVHAAWLRGERWRGDMLMQDLKYACRTLVRQPAFSLVVIATLALGIGANVAIFSAVRAVLLRPLPFPEPDRLVRLFFVANYGSTPSLGTASPPDFTDWRHDSGSFLALAAFDIASFPLTGDGQHAEQLPGANVTGGFFTALGVRAQLGRTLSLEDDSVGAADVAVISDAIWRRRFGGDPEILDALIDIDGLPRRVVGVMPPGFSYPSGADVWVPRRFDARELETQRGAHYLDVIGRLKPGTTLEAASADMRVIGDRLAGMYPRTNYSSSIAVRPLHDVMVGPVRPALQILLGAVGFLLLIVCVNVASLVLTRAVGRTRELMVRAALGAGRHRLVRGLLIESLVIAVAGGLAGLVTASWMIRAIAALPEGLGIPRLDETSIDGIVLAFAANISVLASVLVGALPAWHVSSTRDVAQRIRQDGGTTTGARERHRLRSALIVGEVALAVVLLVSAGLLMRSFARLVSVSSGFDPAFVHTFNISLPETKFASREARMAFVDTLLARLDTRPDVAGAGVIFGLPLTDFRYGISTSTLDGRKLDDQEQDRRTVQVRVVSPDYFRTLGIRVLRGRAFDATDTDSATAVAVISEAAAQLYWPGDDPLGHQFEIGSSLGQARLGGPRQHAGGTVVGVVGDVRDYGPSRPLRPTIYLPYAQNPMEFLSVAVRTDKAAPGLLADTRALLAAIDPDVPMYDAQTMEQRAADAVAQPRLYALLLGIFAGTALSLAALGIYGVLGHAVSQRTREIGLRLALGAERRAVIAMVVRQAGALALAGLVIGLVLAAAAGRAIESVLFATEATDAATYAAVVLTFTGVALVAAWLPARRAAGIDPADALRSE